MEEYQGYTFIVSSKTILDYSSTLRDLFLYTQQALLDNKYPIRTTSFALAKNK